MSIKILGIETSTHACSAALYINGYVDERYQYAPRLHGELILPMINDLLDTAKLRLNELDALAYGCGPGSFTGVRLAASVMQGLALGSQKPVIGVSSLQALAEGLYRDVGFTEVACAFDARMQEVYWGAYRVSQYRWETIITDQVTIPAKILALPTGKWVGVGDGWASYYQELRNATGISRYFPRVYPHAGSIVRLAVATYRAGKGVISTEILPNYLRNNVVH